MYLTMSPLPCIKSTTSQAGWYKNETVIGFFRVNCDNAFVGNNDRYSLLEERNF